MKQFTTLQWLLTLVIYWQDIFADLVDDAHEDIELKTMADEYVKQGGKIKDNNNSSKKLNKNKPTVESDAKKHSKDSNDSGMSEESESESSSDSDTSDGDSSDSDYDTSELYKKEKESRQKEKNAAKNGFETVPVEFGKYLCFSYC
jgi:cobalamin biosynthesis protein CobT